MSLTELSVAEATADARVVLGGIATKLANRRGQLDQAEEERVQAWAEFLELGVPRSRLAEFSGVTSSAIYQMLKSRGLAVARKR